ELGFAGTRWLARKNVYRDLFPQGPIFVWLTAGKYILKRRSEIGPWYAEHMMVFTLKCLERVQERGGNPMVLYSPDRKYQFEFTPDRIRELHQELKCALKSSQL